MKLQKTSEGIEEGKYVKGGRKVDSVWPESMQRMSGTHSVQTAPKVTEVAIAAR